MTEPRDQIELARTTGYGIDPRRAEDGVCWHGIFAGQECTICDSGGPAPCFECNLSFRDGDEIRADGRVDPPILRHRRCSDQRTLIQRIAGDAYVINARQGYGKGAMSFEELVGVILESRRIHEPRMRELGMEQGR